MRVDSIMDTDLHLRKLSPGSGVEKRYHDKENNNYKRNIRELLPNGSTKSGELVKPMLPNSTQDEVTQFHPSYPIGPIQPKLPKLRRE